MLDELLDVIEVVDDTMSSVILWGCEITASTEKEDFSFKMNERSSFMLKLTCDENFNYKL